MLTEIVAAYCALFGLSDAECVLLTRDIAHRTLPRVAFAWHLLPLEYYDAIL
jgi:hypothetical protein